MVSSLSVNKILLPSDNTFDDAKGYAVFIFNLLTETKVVIKFLIKHIINYKNKSTSFNYPKTGEPD